MCSRTSARRASLPTERAARAARIRRLEVTRCRRRVQPLCHEAVVHLVARFVVVLPRGLGRVPTSPAHRDLRLGTSLDAEPGARDSPLEVLGVLVPPEERGSGTPTASTTSRAMSTPHQPWVSAISRVSWSTVPADDHGSTVGDRELCRERLGSRDAVVVDHPCMGRVRLRGMPRAPLRIPRPDRGCRQGGGAPRMASPSPSRRPTPCLRCRRPGSRRRDGSGRGVPPGSPRVPFARRT